MITFFIHSFQSAKEWLGRTLWTYHDTLVTPFTLLRFAFYILLASWLARSLLKVMNRAATKRPLAQRSVIYRLSRLSYYVILGTGILVALSTVGFDFSSFILVASALGIGLGFGLQAIFNNFFSGIILLFESQLHIGDSIELEGGVKGEITAINFRTTTLAAPDGTLILVPNALLINAKVALNWTQSNPYRCLHIPFTLSEVQKEPAFTTIEQQAKEMPSTIKEPLRPNPVVHLVKMKDQLLECELWVWVEENKPGLYPFLYSSYLELVEKVLRITKKN